MPKGRRLTEDVALKLLQGFREAPGRATIAAQFAGVDHRTAKKAWEFGLTATPAIPRPIRDMIHDEQEETRARLAAIAEEQARKAGEEEAERKRKVAEQARIDATESRLQEVQMIRLARAGALGLLASLTTLSKGAAKLGDKVRVSLEANLSSPVLTLQESAGITRLITQMSTAMRQANDAAQKAMEMERLLLGEPTNIVAVQHENLSMTEAEARIKSAMDALESAKARGIALPADTSPAHNPTKLVH